MTLAMTARSRCPAGTHMVASPLLAQAVGSCDGTVLPSYTTTLYGEPYQVNSNRAAHAHDGQHALRPLVEFVPGFHHQMIQMTAMKSADAAAAARGFGSATLRQSQQHLHTSPQDR
jgi:hypothetical protein